MNWNRDCERDGNAHSGQAILIVCKAGRGRLMLLLDGDGFSHLLAWCMEGGLRRSTDNLAHRLKLIASSGVPRVDGSIIRKTNNSGG